MSLSATARVLSTTELLEHIFIQRSSPSDITSCRQVSKFFHAVINGSKKLSSARALGNKNILSNILFQLDDTKEIIKARQVHSHFKTVIDESAQLRQLLHLAPKPMTGFIRIINPMLGIGNPAAYGYTRDIASFDKDSDILPVTFHPAFLALTVPTNGFHLVPRGYSTTFDPTALCGWTPGQIWEDMLICQPPCEDGFRIECEDARRCLCRKGEKGDGGVCKGSTLGDLRNAVVRRAGCGGLKKIFIKGVKEDGDWMIQSAMDEFWGREEEEEGEE